MKESEAIRLIRPAIERPGGAWADLGAGTGVFSRALASLLGSEGLVIAVDRDPAAIVALEGLTRPPSGSRAQIVAVEGDFLALETVRQLADAPLDGLLFANALHFAPDAGRVLRQATRLLSDGGRIVVVEYGARPASRWVPYPVSVQRLRQLAEEASLAPPRVVGERPSAYGGVMYAAIVERLRE
jgi:ubiquinone/menaquinone biosynthesis C-methylase UbiE